MALTELRNTFEYLPGFPVVLVTDRICSLGNLDYA